VDALHKESPLFSKKDIKDMLYEPFFRGLYQLEGLVFKRVVSPALSPHTIAKRLEDTRFCTKCFKYDIHDYYCEKSPWQEYLK